MARRQPHPDPGSCPGAHQVLNTERTCVRLVDTGARARLPTPPGAALASTPAPGAPRPRPYHARSRAPAASRPRAARSAVTHPARRVHGALRTIRRRRARRRPGWADRRGVPRCWVDPGRGGRRGRRGAGGMAPGPRCQAGGRGRVGAERGAGPVSLQLRGPRARAFTCRRPADGQQVQRSAWAGRYYRVSSSRWTARIDRDT